MEIPPMDYNAPENISALDVYEQLDSYCQKQSLGKLVATMHHIDTHPLEDTDHKKNMSENINNIIRNAYSEGWANLSEKEKEKLGINN